MEKEKNQKLVVLHNKMDLQPDCSGKREDITTNIKNEGGEVPADSTDVRKITNDMRKKLHINKRNKMSVDEMDKFLENTKHESSPKEKQNE